MSFDSKPYLFLHTESFFSDVIRAYCSLGEHVTATSAEPLNDLPPGDHRELIIIANHTDELANVISDAQLEKLSRFSVIRQLVIGLNSAQQAAVADAVVADAVVADAVVADTVVADTVVADTVVAAAAPVNGITPTYLRADATTYAMHIDFGFVTYGVLAVLNIMFDRSDDLTFAELLQWVHFKSDYERLSGRTGSYVTELRRIKENPDILDNIRAMLAGMSAYAKYTELAAAEKIQTSD